MWRWPFVERGVAAGRSCVSTRVICAAMRTKMGDMCHTAELCDLAGTRSTGAARPPGFSTTLQIPGCHINPLFKSNLPSPVIDSYIFFSSLGAAKQHPAQLKAIQLQDQAHTAREARGLSWW